jgi:hypothetical protein
MTAKAVIVHQIPGRIRIRIPEKRGDSAYFLELSEKLAGIDNVQNVKTNAATGSVVIEFSSSLDTVIEKLRLLDLDVDMQQSLPEKQPVSMPRDRVMKPLNIVSGREINSMFMMGSLLTVIGLAQTFRGKILAPALTAFWYAMEAFRQSRNMR